MEAIDIVNAAFNGDQEALKNAFNDVIAAKVSDALEIKKVEVASNFITPNDESNSEEELEFTDEEDNATESEEESDGTESE